MKEYTGQIRCKKFVSWMRIKNRNIWRLSPYRYTTFNKPYFVQMAALDAGITQEQMEAALRAYQNQFDQLLLNGHSLELEGLGNFRLSVSVKTVTDVEELSTDLVQRLRVVFRPCVDLRDNIKGVKHIVDKVQYATSANHQFTLNHQMPIRYDVSRDTAMKFPAFSIIPSADNLTIPAASQFSSLFFKTSKGLVRFASSSENSISFDNDDGEASVVVTMNFTFNPTTGVATLHDVDGFEDGDSITYFGGTVMV